MKQIPTTAPDYTKPIDTSLPKDFCHPLEASMVRIANALESIAKRLEDIETAISNMGR